MIGDKSIPLDRAEGAVGAGFKPARTRERRSSADYPGRSWAGAKSVYRFAGYRRGIGDTQPGRFSLRWNPAMRQTHSSVRQQGSVSERPASRPSADWIRPKFLRSDCRPPIRVPWLRLVAMFRGGMGKTCLRGVSMAPSHLNNLGRSLQIWKSFSLAGLSQDSSRTGRPGSRSRGARRIGGVLAVEGGIQLDPAAAFARGVRCLIQFPSVGEMEKPADHSSSQEEGIERWGP